MEDIAVVGIGLRFPGNATSLESLWKVLEKGESQWSEFPKDRLNIDGYYHPSGDRQGSISFRGAHFLKGDIAEFDAPFFSVSADDAKAIDPQQRLLLETSYEALENAGIRKEDIEGSDTAVFVGSFVKDYEQICLRDPDWQPRYAATGNGIAIMANRISYAFDFHGPSMTIDTGCSGSLVSVHLAAQSLRNGECSMALAAGAGMILTPNTIMPMTALNFLSADGKCFTFDSRANGYGRGEGVGVVVLKRLSDALRDNDTIRSVIRGSSVNQDGRTAGNKEAQVANIRALYASSGLGFDQTGYVECHGTGTQAGDWRELKAISETIGSVRVTGQPIICGSIKPNIGHLEGAAGVAGLIKSIMILERGKIPPNINFENGNSDIDFEKWKVEVPRELMNWPLQGIRRVSVNCFGFGGTNAHVIMDEAPAYLAELGLKGQHNSLVKSKGGRAGKRVALANNDGPQLFCYSSNESSGVSRLLKTHASYLRSQEEGKMVDMQNYAYTLACRRSTLDWKTAVVATSVSELADKLESLDKSAFSRSFSDKKPRICFIFCGQGSQWAGMGKSLMKFEAFRESITAASWYMVNTLESTFDLIEEMFRDEEESRICSPEISQPATTALQIALVELLTSFQMTPQYVVGHSSGEIAAAFASGAITRESAWRVSYYRGLAAKTIPAQSENRRGGMVAVSMAPRQAEQYLASITSSAQVACINSPHSVTLSGSIDSIDFIANDLSQQKIFHRVLPVGIAYHSNSMRLVEHEYRRSLSDIRAGPNSEGVTMISSVTGEAIEGTVLAGPYWVENMVSPVNYLAAINRLMNLSQSQRPDIIIELSPHSTLRSPTAEILSSLNMKSPPSYFAVLHRKMSGVESLLQTLGSIWARGQHLQMEQVISRGEINEPMKCLVDLPPYPWNHTKSYWHESHLGKASRFREYPRQDLIGAPTADSTSFEPRWRGFLRLSENPWIQDHRVQKSIIYPAAGMISMVLEGAKQMAKGADDLLGYEILDMRIEKAMLIPSTEHGLEVALNVKRSTFHPAMKKIRGLQEFAIYSKLLDGAWEKHATGSLRFSYKDGDWESMVTGLDEDYESAKETCNEPVVPRQLYELLDTIGMNYGPLFRNITEIRRANNTCVSTVRIPNTKSKMPAKFEYPHLIHPATLDSMIQTLFAIEPVPMVPAFIERFFATADLNQGEASEFTGYSTAEKRGLHSARANITMRQQHSAAYITIEGLHLKSLETWMPQNSDFLPNHRNLCTEIIWKEDCAFATPPNLREYLELFAHKYPALSVLQIGGGFDLTEAILETLDPNYGEAPRLARLTVAEIENSDDAALALDAVQETAVEPFVETLKLDGSNRLPDYHLILAFEENVTNIDALKRRLLPGGCMLTGSMPMSPMEVSTSRSPKHPSSGPEHQLKLEIFRKPTLPPPGEAQVPPVVLLSPGSRSSEATLFVESLCDSFEAAFPGIRYAIMTLEEAISRLPALRKAVIISLVDVLEEKDEGFVFQWDAEGFESFRSLQKSTKAVVWITRGAHMTPSNPKMSPIVPLARTLMSEDPLKMILSLDLDVSTRLNDKSLLLAMLSIYRRTFCEDHGSQPREMEFAFKNGRLYIPRLATITPLNELIENGGKVNATKRSSFNYDDQMNVSGAGLRLAINELVPSENGPTFVEFSPRQAGPAEVEVVFTGAPLTPLDADVALGRTRKTLVGMDVIGRIKSVGSGVTDLVAGQEVVALVPDGSLQNILCVDRRFVAPFAKGFVPSLFVNAYYGLAYIGRIDSRRTVFVHAGASCFGIAAIQVCLHAGAEVYTSVVGEGSQQQRQVLERGGMSTDRIFDANSDKFIATIIEATAGVGVDIIYNPSGARMDLIGRLIRRGGTIIQFNDDAEMRQSVRAPKCGTLLNIDLAQLMRDEPNFVAELFDHTRKLIQTNGLEFTQSGMPYREFRISRLAEAFKFLEVNRCMGSATVVASHSSSEAVSVMSTEIKDDLLSAINPRGTYLLAGGLGGLGRSISALLVKYGAKHLAFISRSGAVSDVSREFIFNLVRCGVDARVYQVDICDRQTTERVIRDNVSREMPSVVGVFQCAAVVKDAVFDNMTYEDWTVAFRPKANGSLNLVESMAVAKQDPFFVFLSSSAGVIGNRGQANYAAGNGFEDALARCCQLKGKRAVSIDLGPVLGTGMLAEDEKTMDMLRASGFYGIRHEDFLTVIKYAITMNIAPGVPMPPQVVLGVGTGGLMRQNQPADPYWARTALYSYLNLVDMPPPDLSALGRNTTNVDIKTKLACCIDPADATEIVCTGLMHMLAKATNILFEEMDPHKPPSAYGVDSLVAVGVRNWVLNNFSVEISVFEVLSGKAVADLATLIVEKGGFGEGERAGIAT